MNFKEYIYLEGKQQAIQILVPIIGENKTKSCIKKLTDFDPTSPKNKYIELFARIFKDILLNSNNYNDVKEPSRSTKLYVDFIDDMREAKVFEKLEDIEKRNLTLNQSKIKTFNDFIEQIREVTSVITKSVAKQGLTGLKKGTDYIEIPVSDKSDFNTYIPLNYEASKILASNKVGIGEGKWCTAYQKTDEYWIDYVVKGKAILVYNIAKPEKVKTSEYFKQTPFDIKQAGMFYKNGDYVYFNSRDKNIDYLFEEFFIKKYLKENWTKI